jgi:hypothetical protein
MKKLFIETYGCQMNVADSEVVASVMKMAGYDVCEDIADADAVFLNTCSVRDNAEQKIYHRLEELNALRNKKMSVERRALSGKTTEIDAGAAQHPKPNTQPLTNPFLNSKILTY